MKNKKITIEDLAVIIKNGFDGVDKRLDGVEDNLSLLIDSSKKQFDDICERLDLVERKLGSMDVTLKSVLSETKALRDKLETKLDHKEYLELEKRVVKLEKLAFVK